MIKIKKSDKKLFIIGENKGKRVKRVKKNTIESEIKDITKIGGDVY
ncbi:14239_t:CDS:2 [Entrophospora sp. SA101]|nr:14239_t:CDS:2 [Entrophospora sp. SA101]